MLVWNVGWTAYRREATWLTGVKQELDHEIFPYLYLFQRGRRTRKPRLGTFSYITANIRYPLDDDYETTKVELEK